VSVHGALLLIWMMPNRSSTTKVWTILLNSTLKYRTYIPIYICANVAKNISVSAPSKKFDENILDQIDVAISQFGKHDRAFTERTGRIQSVVMSTIQNEFLIDGNRMLSELELAQQKKIITLARYEHVYKCGDLFEGEEKIKNYPLFESFGKAVELLSEFIRELDAKIIKCDRLLSSSKPRDVANAAKLPSLSILKDEKERAQKYLNVLNKVLNLEMYRLTNSAQGPVLQSIKESISALITAQSYQPWTESPKSVLKKSITSLRNALSQFNYAVERLEVSADNIIKQSLLIDSKRLSIPKFLCIPLIKILVTLKFKLEEAIQNAVQSNECGKFGQVEYLTLQTHILQYSECFRALKRAISFPDEAAAVGLMLESFDVGLQEVVKDAKFSATQDSDELVDEQALYSLTMEGNVLMDSQIELKKGHNVDDFAIKILDIVGKRLNGRSDNGERLSVSDQVAEVIVQATDAPNLSRMYEGWMSWI